MRPTPAGTLTMANWVRLWQPPRRCSGQPADIPKDEAIIRAARADEAACREAPQGHGSRERLSLNPPQYSSVETKKPCVSFGLEPGKDQNLPTAIVPQMVGRRQGFPVERYCCGMQCRSHRRGRETRYQIGRNLCK